MATAGAAYASDSANSGGYIGAAVGSTNLPSESDNSSATSFGVTAGYRVNDNFAIEASYLNLGTAELSMTEIQPGVVATGEIELTGINFSVVGILPVSDRVDLYGKLGLLTSNADTDIMVTASGGGMTITESISDSESGTNISLGIGAQVHISKAFSLVGEYNRYDSGDEDLDSISIGARFKF